MQRRDSKEIALLTRRAGTNYGSTLQAFAMQWLIEQCGYSVEMLNYDELHHNLRWRVRPFLYDRLQQAFELMPALSAALFPKRYQWSMARKGVKAKFKDFEDTYFHLTPQCYKSSAQLQKAMAETPYVAVVCGSDQVWSPQLFDATFFLNFVPDTMRKIAFSPSVGVSKIEQHEQDIASYATSFHALSVREAAGAQEIARLTGREVSVTLDPTLILPTSLWRSMEQPVALQEPYILSYFLGEHIPTQAIHALQEQLGAKVYHIDLFYTNPNAHNFELLSEISPGEFLWLIDHAAAVCTDSFHATLFSIHFQVPFFTFERFKVGAQWNQNSRIYHLLERLNLSHRIVDNRSQTFNLEIDYPMVQQQLELLRKESIHFLEAALAKTDS